MPPSFRPVRPHTDSWLSKLPRYHGPNPALSVSTSGRFAGERKGVPGPLKEREAKRNGHGRNQPGYILERHSSRPWSPQAVERDKAATRQIRKEAEGLNKACDAGAWKRISISFSSRRIPSTPKRRDGPARGYSARRHGPHLSSLSHLFQLCSRRQRMARNQHLCPLLKHSENCCRFLLRCASSAGNRLHRMAGTAAGVEPGPSRSRSVP